MAELTFTDRWGDEFKVDVSYGRVYFHSMETDSRGKRVAGGHMEMSFSYEEAEDIAEGIKTLVHDAQVEAESRGARG